MEVNTWEDFRGGLIVVVFVDGVVYHDAYWNYVPASNRIDFILEPPGGSLVEIAYHY